jgi:hypothetical protein
MWLFLVLLWQWTGRQDRFELGVVKFVHGLSIAASC